MTYWYDAERCTGFCLVDAPDAATAARVHSEAHGEIASDIIAVDLATVEAFLGRISDPRASVATAPEMDAGLRAVLFTDIVGSTELTARLGDAAALELVRVHDALVRRGLASHGGREVKHTGDGIMAAFDEVANAVRAAADIQRHFSAYNAEASEGLRVRIGIHAGEPLPRGGPVVRRNPGSNCHTKATSTNYEITRTDYEISGRVPRRGVWN
jgi:class 3 adenylate cyclase